MKAKPYQRLENGNLMECAPAEATHLWLRIPGPLQTLLIPVLVGMSKKREGTGCWSWNGSVDRPTLKPSVLNDFRPPGTLVNHIWVTDGKVQFLSDCTHELAGQTVDLLEVE